MFGSNSNMSKLSLAIVLLLVAFVDAKADTVAEQYLLSAINQERAMRNLAPLRIDAALKQAAANHAQQMANHRAISHRFPGELELSERGSSAGARFDLITENVAEGPTAVILQDAWMRSAAHRANILDSAVDSVGISVVARDGQLYAVEDFQRSVQSLTLEQQEATVGMLLDQAGIEILSDSDARQTCAMQTGYAGDQQPAFVMRYTTADLSRLPDKLRARIARGQEHHAAVGACPVAGGSAFTTYRIAIVLYQ